MNLLLVLKAVSLTLLICGIALAFQKQAGVLNADSKLYKIGKVSIFAGLAGLAVSFLP